MDRVCGFCGAYHPEEKHMPWCDTTEARVEKLNKLKERAGEIRRDAETFSICMRARDRQDVQLTGLLGYALHLQDGENRMALGLKG